MFKVKLRSILFLVLLALPVIPLYNRLMTHARPDRYSFNVKTLLLEYVLVLFLVGLVLFAAKVYKKNKYDKYIFRVIFFVVLICISTFLSVLFSWDMSHSIHLYMFGVLGPFFLFILIGILIPPTMKNLDVLMKGFLYSCGIYLLISFLFVLRTVSLSSGIDLLEFRFGGNIYGSNAAIGAISFLLPLVFVKNNFAIDHFSKRSLYLTIFSIMSIVWIILSISRWGYAVLIFTYLISTILIEKKVNLKIIILLSIAFILASYFLGNILEIIINRFTGGEEFLLANVIEYTQEETRFVRWANALMVIKDNPLFGIGLGNNYLIDVRQSPSAHNLLINFSVERGLITLFTLVGLVWSAFRLDKRLQKTSKNLVFKRHSKVLFIGIVIFFIWSLTAGSFVQAGGIISAVKAYYFMVAIALIVLISRVDGKSLKHE